jgi:DNA-directed RNA polymerase specialized sigma subunit
MNPEARERNWSIKVHICGRAIDDIPQEASPFYRTEEDRRLRRFKEGRALKKFPAIMEIIETKLTERQRDAILWFYGLPRQNKRQVGDLMGIDRTTVLRHIEWGMKKIRKQLGVKVG